MILIPIRVCDIRSVATAPYYSLSLSVGKVNQIIITIEGMGDGGDDLIETNKDKDDLMKSLFGVNRQGLTVNSWEMSSKESETQKRRSLTSIMIGNIREWVGSVIGFIIHCQTR